MFFTEREISVNESDGSVQLTLNLSEEMKCPISLLVKIEDNTANSKLWDFVAGA